MYPVGSCCIIAARDLEEATAIAKATITHTEEIEIEEVDISKPTVIIYLSGDY